MQNLMRGTTHSNDLFTLPDLDSDSYSDSDAKPNGYIALCRSVHTAQSQIQIPILPANYRNGIGIQVCTRVCQLFETFEYLAISVY